MPLFLTNLLNKKYNITMNLCNVELNKNLRNCCTMKVGGFAKYYIEPKTLKEFLECIKYFNENNIKYFILGNGSNVIFRDSGFNGAVVCTKRLKAIKVKKNIVCVETGVNLYVLNKFLIDNNLGGMEWSYGIPGTIGGGVFMNAGAYGGEMKDVVLKVLVYDGKKTMVLYNNELGFNYRDSVIKQKNYIVLKVWLKLNIKSKEDIKNLCNEYFSKRKLTQPLEYHNSGSIFKKSGTISSGKMIDKLGLKGVKIGGAEISTLHANFIINSNNATSKDIEDLICLIKQKVKDVYNIELDTEVIVIGE